MKNTFLNGRIIVDGYLYEDVLFDVAGNNLSVCFDGKGGVSKYLSVLTGKNYTSRSVLTLYKNRESTSPAGTRVAPGIGSLSIRRRIADTLSGVCSVR